MENDNKMNNQSMGTSNTHSSTQGSSHQNSTSDSSSRRAGGNSGSKRSAAQESTSSAQGEESKSVGAVIAQSLARESQESIDNIISQVSSYFKATTDYVNENPREAATIALSAGMAAYVLLATKPGRRLFDAGAERFVPEVSGWISRNFSGGVKH